MERDLGSLVVGDDGRTAVKGGAAVLREELFRAKRDSDRAVGAQALLEWIDAWPGDQPAAPVPVEAVGAGVAFPAGFPGWRQSAAPGALLPPLPLNFELPVGPAPVLAVAPWWDEVTLRRDRTSPPISSMPGKRAMFGSWNREGWGRGSIVPYTALAELRAYDEELELEAILTFSDQRIKGPGLIGSLVPVYSDVRSLASTASTTTSTATVGCRLRFEFISAVWISSSFDLEAGLLDKTAKRLLAERGYARHSRWTIGVELSDGWAPWSLRLEGEFLKPEEEASPFQFGAWLAATIAHRRLGRVDSGGTDHRVLAAAVAAAPAMEDSSRGRHLYRTARIDLPAAVPVSVLR